MKTVLYPEKMQTLTKKRLEFSQKSDSEKLEHKHSWTPAVIPISAATRNQQKTEICFICGQIGKHG